MDPAIANTQASWSLLDLTCARLMTYPDKPPPQSYRLIPEVAAAPPKVSRRRQDVHVHAPTRLPLQRRKARRRPGVRNGRSTARWRRTSGRSARATWRTSSAPARCWRDERRAQAASSPAAIAWSSGSCDRSATSPRARACRSSAPFPRTFPPIRRVGARFPGSGPYYVVRVPARPTGHDQAQPVSTAASGAHYVDGFSVDLTGSSPQDVLDRIEDGRADWGIIPPPLYFAAERALVQKYGINKKQFFVRPGFTMRAFMLNTSSPLFRGNAALRKAINYAVDRPLFAGSGDPGARGSRTSSCRRRCRASTTRRSTRSAAPTCKRARALARGHLPRRQGHPLRRRPAATLALGQVLKKNLAEIGLDVRGQGHPATGLRRQDQYAGRAVRHGVLRHALRRLLRPVRIPQPLFREPLHRPHQLVEPALADRTTAACALPRACAESARLKAYGRLDADLMRDVAPVVPLAYIERADARVQARRLHPAAPRARPRGGVRQGA